MENRNNNFIISFIKAHYIFSAILALAILFGLPYLVHLIVSKDIGIGFIETDHMDSWIGFYGTLLTASISAIITIIGVKLSITTAQSNLIEDTHNRSKPYLSNHYIQDFYIGDGKLIAMKQLLNKTKSGEKKDNSREENKLGYKEEELSKIFIEIRKEKPIFKLGLNDKEKEIRDASGYECELSSTNKIIFKYHVMINLPLKIVNNGTGPACDLVITFDRKNAKDPTALHPISLSSNQSLKVTIFSSELSDKMTGEYVLGFHYTDIFARKYRQEFEFSVEKDGSDYLLTNTYFSKQEIISK